MHFDTDGVYTLLYAAEDSCGNETIEERTVEVVTLHTTLFTDGTFIINEKSTDRDANIALHGAVTNEYDPLDANHSYVFSNTEVRPWYDQRASIKSVKIGSPIKPGSMRFWFEYCTNLTTTDFTNLDTSLTRSMDCTFSGCRKLTFADVGNFNTESVTTFNAMFANCEVLSDIDVSGFDTSAATSLAAMFSGCKAITSLDLRHFDVSNVTTTAAMFASCSLLTDINISGWSLDNMQRADEMFSRCYVLNNLNLEGLTFKTASTGCLMMQIFSLCRALTSLDLSAFDFSEGSVRLSNAFYTCSALETIYANETFVPANTTDTSDMFGRMSTNLKGGAGTVWSSDHIGVSYAHIDGGTADPGYFTAKP